jgi:crossover junction endodeoxyribonuclease RuvC
MPGEPPDAGSAVTAMPGETPDAGSAVTAMPGETPDAGGPGTAPAACHAAAEAAGARSGQAPRTAGSPAIVRAATGLFRIIGIDPGSHHTGYGVVEMSGSAARMISYGRISPGTFLPFAERLRIIFEGLGRIMLDHVPQACSLEDVFSWKNPRSAFRLAQARGAAITAMAVAGVPVFEYSPTMVKSSVCGSGRADKAQVAFMVTRTLGLAGTAPPDATDALAVALCHAAQAGARTAMSGTAPAASLRSGKSSWADIDPGDLARLGYRTGGAG